MNFYLIILSSLLICNIVYAQKCNLTSVQGDNLTLNNNAINIESAIKSSRLDNKKVKNTKNIIKIGYMAGHGFGQRFVDYDFSIYMPEMFVQMWQKGTWTIDLLGQPHLVLTHYEVTDENIGRVDSNTGQILGLDPSHEKKSGYEFGLNVGWVLRKAIYKDYIDCYFLPSIGPHYISGAPLRQVSGFIFSDNLYVGTSVKIKNVLFADARAGFRHISNADTVLPNRGINSYIVLVGFYYVFK